MDKGSLLRRAAGRCVASAWAQGPPLRRYTRALIAGAFSRAPMHMRLPAPPLRGGAPRGRRAFPGAVQPRRGLHSTVCSANRGLTARAESQI
eukprot:296256-Chlamydomonas_euryale.AAC.3